MRSLTDSSAKNIGGKAKQLIALQLAGFRVPDFLCSPADVEQAVEILGFPLAVRSSASVEDGGEISFAGQFQSFLNLQTIDEVQRAIHICKKSIAVPSVTEYCRKNGIDPHSLRMSVVVQRMIQPELAGVVFTVNPATGAEEVVIEACAGLADKLLAGHEKALPADHPLVQKYSAEIERVARDIQRHFGVPQDIEFAIENGQLFILQARPITRIHFAPGTGEWTNANFRDGGVSSTVCTPLMWSLYDFIWESTLKGFLREIKLLDGDFQAGAMFFGRPYWNLGAVKQCLAKLPGFGEREFDRDLDVRVNYAGNGIETPMTMGGMMRALPTILAIPSLWKKQEAFNRRFLENGFKTTLQKYEVLFANPEAAFHELIHEAYWTTESNYFRTVYCVSLAKLAFMGSFPHVDYPALVSALPPMKHLDPTRALREMTARGEEDFVAFQKQFGHHSRRELDLRTPRWDEDHEWVSALLKQQTVEAGNDPKPAYEAARREALKKLPWHQRRSFARKLDRLRHLLWQREEMRDLSSRMYHLIRRYALAIARQRGLGDDIFFMSFQEILADDRSNILRNRERYESFRNFKAPNEIGSRFQFAPAPAQGALRGIGASGGTIHAVARVARNIEEGMQVERGAILICPFTDPGWTPVLSRVSGVVTETGGLLTHAAVICREYGIPAVLGVANATHRIRDGSFVTIHGSEGFVEIDNSKKD